MGRLALGQQGARQGWRLSERWHAPAGSDPLGRRGTRRTAVLLSLTGFLSVLSLLVVTPAVAGLTGPVDVTGWPDYIPSSFLPATRAILPAGEAVAEGAAAVGTATVLVPEAVIAGGAIAGYAIGTAARGPVRWLWSWAFGHDPAYADPSAAVNTGEHYPSSEAFSFATSYGTYSATWVGPTTGCSDYGCYTFTYQLSGGSVGQGIIGTRTLANGDSQIQFYTSTTPGGSSVAYGVDNAQATGTTEVQIIDRAGYPDAVVASLSTRAPSGSAVPPGGVGSTPITTTPQTKCSDGSTQNGAAIHYTGATDPAVLPAITYPGCPGGSVPTQRSTPTTTDAGTVASPLPTWTAPAVPAQFPACQPVGTCHLTLTKHSATGTGVLVCNGTAICTGWATDPPTGPGEQVRVLSATGPAAVGDTVTENAPADPQGDYFECAWGPYNVEAQECTSVATEGNPGATDPGTPVVPPGLPDNCSFSDLSLNPVSWIVTPLKCLFIPSAATSTTMTGLATDVGGRAPLSYLADAAGFVGGVLGSGSDGGCLVFNVTLPSLGTFHIIDTCNPADPIMKAITPLRPLLLVASYVGFLGPLAWWAWRSYAPLSRPQG